MICNKSTIYNKEIEIHKFENMNGDIVSVRAVPTPGGATFMSNILILLENKEGKELATLMLDKDDAIEFASCINSRSKSNGVSSCEYSVKLGKGVPVDYDINVYNTTDEFVEILAQETNGSHSSTHDIIIDIKDANDFCKAIVDSSYQASDILDANRNLIKQMKELKLDMKHDKVKELHFDLIDELPKMYSSNQDMARIYEITPYGYDGNPTGYSFYRIMHLTGVAMVDFRDYGKEFMSCPFVYSDKMIERGKKFLDSKKSDLHDHVESKINK